VNFGVFANNREQSQLEAGTLKHGHIAPDVAAEITVEGGTEQMEQINT